MKNENYIQIQGWMINELNLSGNDLLCYAIIYGFSQDGESKFNGSASYLSKSMNCSKPTVFKSLNSLIDKGFITKDEIYKNGLKFCEYNAVFTGGKESLPVKKLKKGSKETLSVGGQESLSNITTINNTNDKLERETKRFQPPTIQQINDYIFEKTGCSDLDEAENFFNYYESKGWIVGRTKMKKWKNSMAGWLKRKDIYNKQTPKRKVNDGSDLFDLANK